MRSDRVRDVRGVRGGRLGDVANASVCSAAALCFSIRAGRRSSVNAERDSRGRSWRRRWRAGSRCTPGSTRRPGMRETAGDDGRGRRPATAGATARDETAGGETAGTRRRAEPCVPSNRRRRLRRRFRRDRRVRRVRAPTSPTSPPPKAPSALSALGTSVRLDLPVATRRGCGRGAGCVARVVSVGSRVSRGRAGMGPWDEVEGRGRCVFVETLARRRVSRAWR